MKLYDVIGMLCIFMIGFLLGVVALDSLNSSDGNFEKALDFVGIGNAIGTYDRRAPADHIPESKIKVYSDKIILEIKDASWSYFSDTKSMVPVLDKGANGIEIKPKYHEQINVGDIISYRDDSGDLIIHRVVEKGFDDEGIYFILKGDNNLVRDPHKVRFEQIHGLLVGIIY